MYLIKRCLMSDAYIKHREMKSAYRVLEMKPQFKKRHCRTCCRRRGNTKMHLWEIGFFRRVCCWSCDWRYEEICGIL